MQRRFIHVALQKSAVHVNYWALQNSRRCARMDLQHCRATSDVSHTPHPLNFRLARHRPCVSRYCL